MGYNYIPKYIRQSENKSPKSVVTASRWNTLFNLLIQQGDYTAEELGKILDYLSTEVDDRANEKLDKTGGVITGNLGVTGKLNIGTTVSITETNNNLLQLAGDYGAPVTISNVDTPVADNDAATKKYVDEHTGDASESVLYVNITQSDSGRITGDKTYDEILAAVTAGKCVIAKLAGMSFCLDSVANDKITFQRLDIVEDDGEGRRSIQKTLIYVYNDGVWTGDAEFVAVDTAMSDTSVMPVQNKVVKAYIDGLTGDISGKQDKSTLEADVAAKGFTKNTGTYSKPADGIPKSDLAAAVQTSLDKADSALQRVPIGYRTAAAQDAIDRGKVDKVDGKGLSTNDYTDAAKAKVDAIPANPKYTDTVYDDTALKERVATIEGKESAWDAKSDFSGSYNDLTDKPTIPAEVTPLIGTTGTLTPTQVYDAVSAGIPVKVQYTDGTYGLLSFTAFNIAESLSMIVAQVIVYYNSVYILAELGGNIQAGNWFTKFTVLAEKTDIPSTLPNPNALTIKIGSTTVTYDGSTAQTVTIDDGTEVSY